ncbi:MAG TPA: hypothetical protein VMF06_07840 [Candidatus Limnocylindria bacterium]|nr:hypothetical protein [Candidatus Limnocylindria bacterium]
MHREFWDGYNFKHGTNPPRENWRPPPQLPAEETEAAFARFGQYIDHLRAVSGVHFVMATNLPVLYPDRTHAEAASADNLQQIVRQALDSSGKGLDFIVHSGRAYSLADQFELLTRAVCHQMNPQEAAKLSRATGLLGPDGAPPASLTNAVIAWPAFRDATRDVLDYLEVQHRIPSRVFIGADAVPPTDFLVGLAYALDFYWKHGALPVEGGVPLGSNREILPARHVAQDTPKVFGNWVIHRAGFRAPKILEIARLQAWTLKPALPAE